MSAINREYHKWHSSYLNRDMELLVFGHAGAPVLFFPTRTARFYDYENWRIIEAMHYKIEAGAVQIYCVDSIDAESFYCSSLHPGKRIMRHIEYEQYIIYEVLPFMNRKNDNDFIISAGCSLGAYHAINLAFRHPHLFGKAVGMSGRYDLTEQLEHFKDLFDGYRDENIYYNMPNQFIPNLDDENYLTPLRKLKIILAIGKQDPFYGSTKLLSDWLHMKQVPHELYEWNEEAHRPKYWRKMVQFYL